MTAGVRQFQRVRAGDDDLRNEASVRAVRKRDRRAIRAPDDAALDNKRTVLVEATKLTVKLDEDVTRHVSPPACP